jgi:hypothetical protein
VQLHHADYLTLAKIYNIARMSTATTGTGTITLGSAVSGYLTFALAGASDGETLAYGIKDGANSEVGTGVYTASGTTLTRSVTKSTNSDTAISLSGTAEVFITARAQDLLQFDAAMSLTSAQKKQGRENIGASVGIPDVIIEEQQTSGTAAGASTTGSFATRVLNTLVRNVDTMASLSSNQFTLGVGTYYVSWSSPAFAVDAFKSRLQNITDGTTTAYGTSEYSENATPKAATRSVGSIVVTIAGSKAFAIQQQNAIVKSVNGLGVSTGFGTEVYTRVEITKLS